ncbi:putative isochorismatase [Pseudomonas sp. 22 E 5]|jgi:biuret amidohydrolase|uniref:Cysteine hydrolase n=2 Tax=Pseudomonas TaxID=286 RepID=A0A4Y9TBX1_PSEFL|nr:MULTISPECIES: isochorismatase family cysteine hydrolase [Pseudomonas]MCX9151413.1 cysteine hydrolase [Pseudomonas sp. TB1-B1]QXH69197.1 cysteine hydrolase [Pseudomonas asgharzadehiana]TFW41458.1 cysteine hydrolase [Pseudomonas fluorescens]CRM88506.1 putative isochorismatase [Pseudomonas sp. 22 E 5]
MNNKNALLIIDMQQEDGFVLEHFDTVAANTVALLKTARRQRVPVIYTRHINQADGSNLPRGEPRAADGGPSSYRAGTRQVEILELLAPQPDELVIDKSRYSAFHRTDLDGRLKALGVDTLIVCGVLTDVCVLSTVFDAFALGYQIRLVSDACTTTTLAGHYSALLMMANWIYAMEILTGAECLRALENRDYLSLIPERPDLFAHQPHELERTIARLQTHLARTQE